MGDLAGHRRAVSTLVDLLDLCAQRGEAPFLTVLDDSNDGIETQLTYGQFFRAAVDVAAALEAQGVPCGAAVAMYALPSADYLITLAGVILAGAVPAPVNHNFTARELGSYLAVLGPSLLVVDANTALIAQAALSRFSPALPTPIAGINGHSATVSLLPSGDDADHPPEHTHDHTRSVRPDPADTGLVLHSSGTTGLPKAVARSHVTVTGFLDFFADYFTDGERVLNFLPLYHQAGLVLTVLSSIRVGAQLVLQKRYSTSAFWRVVDRHRITHTNLVAPIPTFLLSADPTSADRAHSLRWVVIAGRNDHWARFQERFAVNAMTFYGSTETLQITSTGNPQKGPYPRRTLLEVGHGIMTGPRIDDLTSFRIVDDVGAPIQEPLREGHIEASGRFMFTEYLNNESATRDAFTPDGWFRTGDIGYRTNHDELVLIGRAGGMIRRSGENVAPREIERVLEDHPSIEAALVLGVPDDVQGQEILARIAPSAGADLSADVVFAYLAANLSPFKVPRYLVFQDQFERTPTLKIKVGGYDIRRPGELWHDRLSR